MVVRFSQVAGALATALADVLVPRRCGLCGEFGSFLCPRCVATLEPLSGDRCPTCAGLLPASGQCRPCLASLPPLDSLRPGFVFAGEARRLVHRLKYDRLSALAEPMGWLLAATVTPPPTDLLLPVPLHRRRQRERGFNQSEALAEHLAVAWGVPLERRTLLRQRPTQPQALTTTAAARAANVAGAFAVRAAVSGRRVALVDDVATTGATVRACASALRAAGAARVDAIVFAHGD